MMLSEHLSYNEAVKSQTALRHNIDNTPSVSELQNMIYVAENIFEPIRNWVGSPVYVSSFYRCLELNRRIGSKDTSQHVKGEAIDIDMDVYGGRTNGELFNWVKNNLNFDQLIWEFGDEENPAWVHISLRKGLTNRNQIIYLS